MSAENEPRAVIFGARCGAPDVEGSNLPASSHPANSKLTILSKMDKQLSLVKSPMAANLAYPLNSKKIKNPKAGIEKGV